MEKNQGDQWRLQLPSNRSQTGASEPRDNHVHWVLGIFKPHVVVGLLASLHGLLQIGQLFVTGGDNARSLDEFNLGLPKFTL